MTIDELRERDLILLECVSGSRAYGTDIPGSDTDLKGVFIAPPERFFGFDTIEQVNDEGNNQTFYELGRYLELLLKNNPNVMELLAMPPDCVIRKHPLLDAFTPDLFLSRLCCETYAGYAIQQTRKARGLNKKISNPMDRDRKSMLEFCYVTEGQGSRKVVDWLTERGWQPEHCGLVNIPHMRNMFALFHDSSRTLGYRGIANNPEARDVSLSSVPKEAEPDAWMSFNQDGYSKYCREYREYWNWVARRNEERYATTIAHGKNYDSKNLMHTMRLLDMAGEIARGEGLKVRRPNRGELLAIRSGDHGYEELVQRAEEKIESIRRQFQSSPLPETPDRDTAEARLIAIRRRFYFEGSTT